jgi:hypothetical protein
MPYRIEDLKNRQPVFLQQIAEAKTPAEKLKVILTLFQFGKSRSSGSATVEPANNQESSDKPPES